VRAIIDPPAGRRVIGQVFGQSGKNTKARQGAALRMCGFGGLDGI